MKFSEMKYERPDMEALKAASEEAVKSLAEAENAEQAKEAYDKFSKTADRYYTMFTLTMIRHSIDTTDKFYDEENEFFNEQGPIYTDCAQNVSRALAESRFRPELEKIFGSLMFKNIDISLKAFSPEIIPEMQEENKLTADYQKLIASAQIPFNGETLTLSQLTPYKQSCDDDIRHDAWAAESAFYKSKEAELDDIFSAQNLMHPAYKAKRYTDESEQ